MRQRIKKLEGVGRAAYSFTFVSLAGRLIYSASPQQTLCSSICALQCDSIPSTLRLSLPHVQGYAPKACLERRFSNGD